MGMCNLYLPVSSSSLSKSIKKLGLKTLSALEPKHEVHYYLVLYFLEHFFLRIRLLPLPGKPNSDT